MAKNNRKLMAVIMIVLVIVAIMIASGVTWGIVRGRVLSIFGLDNFYPIVSKEVADNRENDKKGNLGIMEPNFASLNREFAGFSENVQ